MEEKRRRIGKSKISSCERGFTRSWLIPQGALELAWPIRGIPHWAEVAGPLPPASPSHQVCTVLEEVCPLWGHCLLLRQTLGKVVCALCHPQWDSKSFFKEASGHHIIVYHKLCLDKFGKSKIDYLWASSDLTRMGTQFTRLVLYRQAHGRK